jgi:hypothetical protein
MKVFVPFNDSMVEELGLSLGELVPFNLAYECLRAHDRVQELPAAVGPEDGLPAGRFSDKAVHRLALRA